MPANPSMIQATTESIKKMQEFDVNTLPRTAELGTQMDFADAVAPARQLVSLYQKINLSALAMMPEPAVDTIRTSADSSYSCFESILNFTAEDGKPQRDALVHNVTNTYDMAFNTLVQPICFGLSETADIKALKNNARKALREIEGTVSAKTKEVVAKIEKDTAQTIEKINKAEKNANAVMQNAREAASAVGVSQHAEIFQEEANSCRKIAIRWLVAAVIAVCAFVFVAGVGYNFFWEFFTRKIPNAGDIQFYITRTVLLSATVYALFFCVKNYRANRHNYVVNKHRQNALQTYQVLVDSAKSPDANDIVLTHAARCIFDQRDTGYAKGGGNNEGGNVVNFSPVKTAQKVVESAGKE